jgi:hypothetical protein
LLFGHFLWTQKPTQEEHIKSSPSRRFSAFSLFERVKEIHIKGGLVALVDDEFEYLNQWKWYAKKEKRTYYARRKVLVDCKWIDIYMHHDVWRSNSRLDHIDGNGWNNQLSNLRHANQSENMRNRRKIDGCSSDYKGVSWHKRHRKWEARITVDGVSVFLGSFDSEIAAAEIYDTVAIKHFKEFAKLNFPNTLVA